MKRALLFVLFPLTAIVLILSLPRTAVAVNRLDVLVIYALLTALSLMYGIILTDRQQLSSAHGIGMLAFLSLPFTAIGGVTWALAIGAVLAELIHAVQDRRAGHYPLEFRHRWRTISTVARIIVPFYVAGVVYQAIGGVLPLNNLTLAAAPQLTAYFLTYVALYMAIFLLEMWRQNLPINHLRDNLAEILIALGLPIPFTLLGSEVFNNGSNILFAVFIAGFAVLVISPHMISTTQRRLRTQVDNYRQLSATNQSLYDTQRERVSQLGKLNDVLMRLNGTLSFDVVLETVTESAEMLSGSSGVAVYMYWDDVKGSLALVRSSGMSSYFVADPPDPLLSRALRKTSNPALPPAIVVDAALDQHAAPLRDVMLREGKPAWIELPLVVGGVTMGALVLYFSEPHVFAAENVEVLRTFANQVAQALSNARLYSITDEALERRVGQLLALAAIGHELTATIDLKTICNLVLNHALDATRSTMGAMLLMDETGQVEISVTRGYSAGARPETSQLLNGVVGEAIRRREPLLIDDADADPQFARFALSARSQLTVPIVQNDELLGVITLENPLPAAFGSDDIDFIMQLANQAVIAIDNARLFRRTMEARDRLQLMLNTIQEAIILLDSSGTITLANPRVEMLGLKPDALLGKKINVLLIENPAFASALGYKQDELSTLLERISGVWSANSDPTSYSIDSRYVARQTIPIRDEEMMGVLLVFYDETERIRLAQTREDVSRMLIHDLRSPLTAVTTSLKLLNELTPKDSSLRSLVDSTSEAGRRAIRKMLQRVDSLLDVSRMESDFMALDTESTPLAGILQTAREELEPIAQEINVKIRTQIPAALPALNIDADKVERVLLNLIDNALKFSPEGATVTIRAHESSGGMVHIDVIDEGPGIPGDYKARLFDRFVQIKEQQKGKRRGSGLGLTFCRLVVENHGGKIWVSDNPAGGSVFSLTLPTVKEKEKA